jgi:hypothetical protein
MRTVVIAALALLLGQTPATPDLRGRLGAELERARADAAATLPASQREVLDPRADRAARALEAGRPLLALYELEPIWEGARTGRFVEAHEATTSVDAFTTLWQRQGEPVPGRAAAAIPAAAEGLAAAADARGPATYRAALPFAQDADVPSGLYYLGNAESSVAFASFVRGLPWPKAAARSFRSIAAELDTFDREVTAAYEKMDRSQHPAYIQTSVLIRQARTLDGAQHFAGALLEYLLARLRFASIRPAGEPATAARIQAARAALRQDEDHSIAGLFIDMADAALAAGDDTNRRMAAAILNDLLPAYTAAVTAPALTEAAAAPAAQTTITLVRWPFT